MQKFLIQFAITVGLILGGQAAHAAQDACFDLTNCREQAMQEYSRCLARCP